MPGKFVLPIFFLTLLMGSMILGPLLYFAMSAVWPIPFHRAMDRALLISALGALGLFCSRISWRALWPWNGSAWKQVLLGLFIAAVSMQAMIGAHLALVGFTSAHLETGAAGGRVLLAVVAALLVAPLEETIFRGFLQRELVQGFGWRVGWILAAALFAVVHFFKVPVELDHQPVHLWSGMTATGDAFTQLGLSLLLLENVVKALNLFLVGLILGGVFMRSGSLWLNAGLHGGWIFGLLIFTGFTRPHVYVFHMISGDPTALPPPPDELPPDFQTLFGTDILSSPATTVVLVLLGIWIWRFYRHPSVVPEGAPATGPSAR